MQNKDQKKLSRAALLELLIQQTHRIEELEEQLATAQLQLAQREIAVKKAGTMAEAALLLNGVIEATEKAAAQYLENIQRMSGHQQQVCDAMEAEAREQARAILEEAEAAAREQKARIDAYENDLKRRLQRFYDERPGLREMIRQRAIENK